jgi:PAS domain S-box-containing protein
MKDIINAIKTAYLDPYQLINRSWDKPQEELIRDLPYFRNRLFHLLSLYLIPVGLIALIPGVAMAIRSGTSLGYLVAGCDLLIASILICVIITERIKIELKKAIVISTLYFLSVFLMVLLGSFGPGVIFISLVSVLMTLIFSSKVGRLSIWANLLVCIFLGVIIELELFDSLLIVQYAIYDWIAYSSNLMVFSIISYLLINNLIKGLELKIGKLAITKARQKGLLASQTNYVIRTDMSGAYTYVNDSFIRDFGWIYPEDKLLGNNSMLSILDYHHQLVIDTAAKCKELPGTVFQISIDTPKPNGGVRTTLWEFISIRDQSGKPSELQCIGIDISERIRAEQELQLSVEDLYKHNKELQTYAYVISHSLRAPIANILGLVSLMVMEPYDEKATSQYVDALKDSTLSLDQVVKDLSRGVSIGGLGIESFLEDVALQDVFNTIKDELAGLINSTKCELVLPTEAFTVRSYKPYLHVIFYNLISNSITHRSAKPPSVIVSITLDAQYMVISVVDNGIGIDVLRHYDDLFKPYKRVNNDRPGKGLGLFFAKRHVDALGGIILVESEPGEGAVFKVLLPTLI